MRAGMITVARSRTLLVIGGRLLLYLVGVGAAVAGALGIIEAIPLGPLVAWSAFLIGLAIVLAVHEFLDGPI